MTYRQQIGINYEYYVLEHIQQNYDKVWHWSKFPEKILYELNIIKDYDKFKKYRNDIGADLVAFKDNKYYFIQCKNFKDTIYIDTLAGFYFFLYENNLNGVLYYNGKLSERLVDLSTGKIPFINLPFNNENIIFNETKIKITPRDYQIEAYNKLKDLNNSILNLPCSMGKTLISSMLGKDYDNIIILSPTRALTQQNLEKFKEYLGNTFNYILVSIDGKTKIDDINKIIKNKNVISSTFDSCIIINSLIDNLKNNYIIIDEFHNLSNNNINKNNNEINKLFKKNINKLFVSATPIKNFMNIKEENIYKYEWNDAIENKYICDFNIYLLNITDKTNNFIDVIKENYNNLEIKLVKKAYNLIKSMLFNGDKKCICYLTTIEKANIFNKILSLISTTFNIEIEREQIDCNTKRIKRNEIIKNFKSSNKMFILLNVHVLDEGIDIPECDSVYITQPNNNIINIVQRMCRANRIYKNKTECNIYLWCYEKKIKQITNYLFEKINNEIIKQKIFKINENKKDKYIINAIDYDIEYKNNNLNNFEKFNVYTELITYNKITDFLKKYSLIDKKFIDDFYSFYDEGNNNNKFIINLEIVSEWLNSYKHKLKKTLVKSYILSNDYIIKLEKNAKISKSNKEIILLTTDCFKKLCLMSKTKKAEEVRNYFLELEKLLNNFKNYSIK
jgi:superfamily II DNA or RNA helicase/phage anti-repressor protein